MITTAVEARILVVEDDAIVARDIEDSLVSCGYAVVGVAADGEEAAELAFAYQPDLIVMDIRLPGEMDGIATADWIRERFDVPVVYLTAHSDQTTLERAKHAGSWGYLLKPFDAGGLRAAVEVALHRHQADQLLRESEERYRAALDAIVEGVVATDAEGLITFVNPGAEFLLARPAEELLGRPASTVIELVSEPDRPLEDPVGAVLREGGNVYLTGRVSVRLPEGGLQPVRGSVSIMRDGSGRRVGAVVALGDTSISREAERRLIEREARYRELLRGGPWASFVADRTGTVVRCNEAFCHLLGLERREQVEGRLIDAFLLGPATFNDLVLRMAERELSLSLEHSVRRTDGNYLPVLLTLQPDPDDPRDFFGRLVDITRSRGT